MVYKVSKGGVRSGNTLRGLHSLRTKRYNRHACLLGRSSLNNKEVKSLLESNTEDKLITETLGSTDVILSLNKKQRWRLPATVNHMIKGGFFNQEKAMVSILERHKLKRKANCVSFACNKGRVKNVTPKQKRYFSFTSENIDEEKSKRQIRRDFVTEMRKQKKLFPRSQRASEMKTVSVYTHTASSDGDPERGTLHSSKREYRLEVFYPCPSSCSLAFNPKYTDVVLEQNDEGKMEVRTNCKAENKSQKHHRKRFTSKDLEILDSDLVYEDVEDMWRDDYKDNKEGNTTENRNMEMASENKISDNILASLVAQAEQAKELCGKGKQRRRRKTSSNQDQFTSNESDEKSHIVYVSRGEPQQSRKLKGAENITNKKENVPPTLSSARVILSTEETQPMALRTKLGHLYAEAESEPRRFAINVTDDIRNLLSLSRTSSNTLMYSSYLIFIHDGFYDEGYDIFRVMFNSNLCKDASQIMQGISFEKTSVGGIINDVADSLFGLKELGLLNLNDHTWNFVKNSSMHRFVNERMKVKVEAFYTADEFCRIANTETMQEKTDFNSQLNKVMDDFDLDFFCEICYENINPTQFDASPGTRLTKCGHLFCDECWKSHFDTQAKYGAVQIMCPGYQCESKVGLVTLLSLVHITEVGRLVQRSVETNLETCPEVKWCPNPKCGRVIRLDTAKKIEELSLDVMCTCGMEMCFSCLSAPHWPAKCDQAESYVEQLSDIKPIKEVTEDSEVKSELSRPPPQPKKAEVVEVEGRLCPGCGRFIEKNGGCPHMSCKCGLHFCWLCLEPIQNHTFAPCKPSPSSVYEHSRRLRVYHIDLTQGFADEPEAAKTKPVSSRQRATMYQRALRQRMEGLDKKNSRKEIADLAVRIAQKTSALKREILADIGVDVEMIPSDEDSLKSMSIKPHLIKFLNSMDDLKRSLHHVAEFTFVLLQDAPTSVSKRKASKLATDLSSYGSFIKSILEAGSGQDHRTVIKRLLDIQTWARRALDTLLTTVHELRC